MALTLAARWTPTLIEPHFTPVTALPPSIIPSRAIFSNSADITGQRRLMLLRVTLPSSAAVSLCTDSYICAPLLLPLTVTT